MKVATFDRFGPPEVLRIVEAPRPSPGRGEALVRVKAVAANTADTRIRAAQFPPGFGPFARPVLGLFRPRRRRRVLGVAFSGVVEDVSPAVEGVQPGDEVCAMTGGAMGAYAEFIAVAADKLVSKPADVSHEDAAAVLFGGTTALYFLRDRAGLTEGQSVLVNGASGAIGTNAVQLAASAGADVTGVTSGGNADLVRSLGATRVIDYTRENIADVDDRFDIVLDAVGNVSIASGRRLLADGGALLLIVASLGTTIRARGNVHAGVAPERPEDMALLVDKVATGELQVVTDGIYEFADIAMAHARVDSGHKVGNVVLRVS